MRRALLVAMLAAPGALAELGIFTVENGAEKPVGALYEFGTVDAGDAREASFRIRNLGSAPAVVSVPNPGGVGFRLVNGPVAPQLLAAGAALDLPVRFEPGAPGSYSATLSAGTASTIMHGTAAAAPRVMVEESGVPRPLSPGASIEFGPAERGVRVVRKVVLQNDYSIDLAAVLDVTGSGFGGPAALAVPVPASQSATVEVWFEPPAAGLFTGELRVGQRRFPLRGTGIEPPLPAPQIWLEPGVSASSRQGRLEIRFDEPSRTTGTGRVDLEFRPAVEGVRDRMVAFASGGLSAGFSVAEGDRAGPSLAYQTGTTAGTLVFTVTLGAARAQASVEIAPAAVALNDATAARASGSVTVSLTGFDNTRSLSQAAFTFYDRNGAPLPPGAVRADVAPAFRAYFDASDIGGLFAMRATFPVAGAADLIDAVEVETANSVGTARTARIKVQ